jgi:predicted ATPase
MARAKKPNIPHIYTLKIKNYRALREVELTDLEPLTVFIAPNGSGKSTIFDVFKFLSECFSDGLRPAWERRGRFQELRSRGSTEPIEIMLQYRENRDANLLTYQLVINEVKGNPIVEREMLRWTEQGQLSRPTHILDFKKGKGKIGLDKTDAGATEETLASPDLLAVNTFGSLTKHERIVALRKFITGWHVSQLQLEALRRPVQAGMQERLEPSGANLANVIEYLSSQKPDYLRAIVTKLSTWIPRLSGVTSETLRGGQLLLQLKDAPFDEPILAQFASDGTLKMLAYLVLLMDADKPPFIGIEEPENHLHAQLLQGFADLCRDTAAQAQLMITTHSPEFLNALSPREVWVMERDEHGYTQVKRASEMAELMRFVGAGGLLGALWMEGYFPSGYPIGGA